MKILPDERRAIVRQCLLSIILSALFFALAGVFLYRNHQHLLTAALDYHTVEQQRVWESVLRMQNKGMEAYLHGYVLQPHIIQILKDGRNGDTRERQIARVRLYRALYHVYEVLKEQEGVRQFHFHDPDSTTLLRFHLPQHVDDSLVGVRRTVELANKTLKPIRSFEGGRSGSGFRNVFPIVADGQHLGSVELSLPFEVLRSNMAALYEDSEFSLLLRDSNRDRLFDEQLRLYAASLIGDDWLVEDPAGELYGGDRQLSRDVIAALPKLLEDDGFTQALNQGVAASFVMPTAQHYYAVTTTPIFDINEDLAATLISFHLSAPVARVYQSFTIELTLSLFLSIVLAMTIALVANRMLKVREQEQRITAIADSVQSGIYVVNRRGQTVFVNRRAEEILGYSDKELLGSPAHQQFHDHTSSYLDCPIFRVVLTGEKYSDEDSFVRKNGERFPVTVASAPVTLSSREPGAVVVFDDITERKQAEDQVRKLSQAVEQSPVVVMITDLDGNIEYVNSRFTQVSGYSVTEAIGSHARILSTGTMSPADYKLLWQKLKTGQQWHGDFHNRHKDGSLFWERARISPMRNEQGEITHYIAIKEDITEQKRLEAQLLHAQKMESVGTLAGGIAHDFNNILSSVSGYTWLALNKMEEGNPLRRNLEQVLVATERATSLTRDLLLFSRKQPGAVQLFDLDDIFAKTEDFWKRTLGSDIILHTAPAGISLPVRGDFNQIQQVLMNLIINARDAIPSGGEVTVRAVKLTIGFGDPILPVECGAGDYALIEVVDTGSGIDPEVLEHIFEPFFTTKATDKGTGLGLAVVYGIVRQHKGFVRVASRLGAGTTFSVYLPLTKDAVATDFRGSDDVLPPPGGKETILLAEDDTQVRAALVDILEEAGYRVVAAVDGEDAIQQFSDHADEVDLLLFDIVMPRMNGKEAADRIHQMQPGIKLLFLSGYAPEALRQKVDIDGTARILNKPAKPVELLRFIREVLDAPASDNR